MPGILVMGSILLVFHLYLLVRWEKVRRPGWFRVGILGFVVILLVNFFFLSSEWTIRTIGVVLGGISSEWIIRTGGVLNGIGLILAFIGAVGSCRPEMLPIIGSADEKATEAVDKVMKDLDQES